MKKTKKQKKVKKNPCAKIIQKWKKFVSHKNEFPPFEPPVFVIILLFHSTSSSDRNICPFSSQQFLFNKLFPHVILLMRLYHSKKNGEETKKIRNKYE